MSLNSGEKNVARRTYEVPCVTVMNLSKNNVMGTCRQSDAASVIPAPDPACATACRST